MVQHKGAIPWNKGIHTGIIPKSAFKKGHVAWSTGLKLGSPTEEIRKKRANAIKNHLPSTAWKKGQHFSSNTEFKRDDVIGDKNTNWKGNDVGYFSLHNWVSRWLGKPQECERCGSTNKQKYEWANKSGEYKRELGDWIRLCVSCHKIYDKNIRTMEKMFFRNGRRKIC